jgi:dTDP-4-dehydrorhamnose 3,5-epimerase
MAIAVEKLEIPDVLLIKPNVHGDVRGFFMESFNCEQLRTVGIEHPFVQDNHSRSGKNVVRGLHYQRAKPQGKLVRVTRGAVFDVAVDIRPSSPTFGQYVSQVLSEENFLQMYIPPGFAHGFCTLSDVVDFQYKVTQCWDPKDEGGIFWNDPELDINWPIGEGEAILSEKDKSFNGLIMSEL